MTAKQKTEKTEKTAANPFLNPMSFDPFATFQPMIQDSFDRMQALYDELATLEREAYDRAKIASAHLNTLVTETMEYAAALTRELRQISLEATRRGVQAVREHKAS